MFLNRYLPLALAPLLLVVLGFWSAHNLEGMRDLDYDEFYSLERSHGFAKFNDWLSVYSLNEPTAKKPPLQYWLNGLAMQLGMSDLTALRFWSWVFFLGLVGVSAGTAYLLKPDNAWVLPATVLLMGCSVQLLELARSGLLDSGLGLFMMAALLALWGARNNPKLWLLCGLVTGLGALQKAPVALLFVGVVLYILKRRQDPAYRWSTLRKNPWFNRGMWTALGLFLIWPVLQLFKYGGDYLNVAIKQEMLDRFSPLGDEAEERSGAFEWVAWLWSDLHWLAVLALICVLVAVVLPRWRRDNATFSYALLACLIIVGFSLASGKIYSRYLAILTPILICVTVKVIADLLPWKAGVFVVSAGFVGLALPQLQQAVTEQESEDTYSLYQQRVAYIDRFREDSDFVVIKRDLIPPGAYGYFGRSRDTFSAYGVFDEERLGKVRRRMARGSGEVRTAILGLDQLSNMEQLEHTLPGIQVVDADGEFMIWRYRPPQ